MSFSTGGGGSSSVSTSTDVALNNVADSQALVYDGGVGKWRNAAVTKTSVGLGEVDNTSDANKPISSAVQAALDAKAADTHAHAIADITNLQTNLDTKPTISSGAGAPALTPTKVGDIYVDTTADDAYIAVGTASSADWEKSNDGSGSGTPSWGSITGTLANQTDLQTVLNAKAASTHTHGQADVTNLTADLASKQPLDSDLTAIAALAPTDNDVIQRKAGAWANRTPAQLKTDLALVKGDVGLSNVDNTSDATKNSAAATLTNKTISGASNTLSNIPQSAVTNLSTDLAGKATTSHTHVRADVTDIGLKVVAQGTAPADTSVIWVKTS